MKVDYVIHSSDTNPYYLDFWPVVSKLWKLKVGVTPVLFVICDEDTDFIQDDYGLVKKIKAVDGISKPLQSQIARWFGTRYFPDHSCLISDIDMLPLQRDFFTREFEDNSLVIFSADAYPQDLKYPMCYNLTSGKNFIDILDLPVDFKDFAVKMNSFGWGWNTDERYFYESVQKWAGKKILMNRGWQYGMAINRLDRVAWRYNPQDIIDGKYIDCHSLRPYGQFKHEVDKIANLVLNGNT